MSEGLDAVDLTLPNGQDALIEAVARANPKTIVVLETGGPVTMPWLGKVSAVLEAWYGGQRGGNAIANVLFGVVNPSGHLPITFPANMAQNPRPVLPGTEKLEVAGREIGFAAPGPAYNPLYRPAPFDIAYNEGADVGYRWIARNRLKPLFPFGYGLSYTSFGFANLSVTGGRL